MIQRNQKLLKLLKSADKLAREMVEDGERVTKVITDLKSPIGRIESRIRGLQRQSAGVSPETTAPAAQNAQPDQAAGVSPGTNASQEQKPQPDQAADVSSETNK